MKKILIALTCLLPLCSFGQKFELSLSNPINMIGSEDGLIDGVTPNGVNARLLCNYKQFQFGAGADIINTSGGSVIIPQLLVNKRYRLTHGYFYYGVGFGYIINDAYKQFEFGMQAGATFSSVNT